MKLIITSEAEEQIKRKMDNEHSIVKLKYETEDCGCVVCGVPTLELTNKESIIDKDYVKVSTNAMDVYIEKSKIVFYHDEMKIGFLPQKQCFQLCSPNEILNARMKCQTTKA